MKINVPNIGDFSDVEVLEVLIQTGTEVAAEDPLLTLESDKATMDVPSPVSGKITAVHIKAGDKISEGTHIADIEEGKKKPVTASAPPPDSDPPPPVTETPPLDTAATASTATSTTAEARVPDIGDFQAVEVIEILIKVGDTIAIEQSLISLESDKATMDIPASVTGVVQEILVKVGDKISEGDLIARLSAAPAATVTPVPATEAKTPPPVTPASPVAPTTTPQPSTTPLPPVVHGDNKERTKPHAGPAVRRFARELGVDLTKVKGSARLGRIIKSDIESYVKAVLQRPAGGGGGVMPEIDFSKFGEIEIHPLSRIKKLSAINLARNWRIAPHVTQMADADITDMEEFRRSLADDAKKEGYKMTPLAFLIRATVAALREYPRFNSSLSSDGESLTLKKYFNIGVAVDTPQGLVVPVLRNAERKGLIEIARELATISARARDGKLKAEDMQGGCFTISSLGGIGGSYFTPILNLPEVAILGVSRSETKPQWTGKEFAPRLMLPLALSYDHRVIDGAEGARFISFYSNLLADIRRLTL